MEMTFQKDLCKSFLKLVLFIMTIISTCFVIWAGFTEKEELLPFLLSLTLFLSISSLRLENKHRERRKFFRIIFTLSLFSVLLGAAHLLLF
ncbi:hypothetical protein [Bacillus sp. JCM 19034]|uniref:hypothetical protein n=1 Tax=Bacillus sp. JCM 19034 TaxID=1481928 RepID=UPI0007817886|nr:hypothetical protein [Bacillus sp. JCM 19034]